MRKVRISSDCEVHCWCRVCRRVYQAHSKCVVWVLYERKWRWSLPNMSEVANNWATTSINWCKTNLTSWRSISFNQYSWIIKLAVYPKSCFFRLYQNLSIIRDSYLHLKQTSDCLLPRKVTCMLLPKLILCVFGRNIPCKTITGTPALLLSAKDANQIMGSRVDNERVTNVYRLTIIAYINPVYGCVSRTQIETTKLILNFCSQSVSTTSCIQIHWPIYLLRRLGVAKLNRLWNYCEVHRLARVELHGKFDSQIGDCICNDNIDLILSSKCILRNRDLVSINRKLWGCNQVNKVN